MFTVVVRKRDNRVLPIPWFCAMLQIEESKKVDRSDLAAFTSLLELDPQADSDDRLFTSES